MVLLEQLRLDDEVRTETTDILIENHFNRLPGPKMPPALVRRIRLLEMYMQLRMVHPTIDFRIASMNLYNVISRTISDICPIGQLPIMR